MAANYFYQEASTTGYKLALSLSSTVSISTTITMKFISVFSLAALAAAAPTADKRGVPSFVLHAEAGGSPLDRASINKVESHPHVFSVAGDEGYSVSLTLNDDGSMKDTLGRGIYVNPDTFEMGNVDPWGEQQPSKVFHIHDNCYLCYNGNCDWRACPSGENKWSLTQSNGNCVGGTPLKLKMSFIVPV